VNDIIHHQNKSEYRLGVIVVQRDKKSEGDNTAMVVFRLYSAIVQDIPSN